MSKTFTKEHRTKLEQYLATHELPSGLGSEESACSIAAINLAVSGKLTDAIPACMSYLLGEATIHLQDAMPDAMRNSDRYKMLLPDMAGTGRDKEQERLSVLMDWMWEVVLPQLQDLADEKGFGPEWRAMCESKTPASASAAAYAADAADAAAATAARAADAAAATAARAAADAAAYAAADAADAAAATAARAAAYAAAAAGVEFWQAVDPIGVLKRMTYLEHTND